MPSPLPLQPALPADDASAPLRSFPAYLRFWWARVAGTMAGQMMMVAVGWQMYDLTSSAWDLGLVGLYQFLPALALTLVVGHVTDRRDRRLVLAACLALQALAAVGLVLATQGGWASRGLILGISLALGVAKAFQMPASQALTPMLVPPEVLPRALAFSASGMQAAIIGGPALGGFIYVAGAPVVYGVCALLFALAALLVMLVRHIAPQRAQQPVTLATLFAGFSFIWHRKAVLGAISLDLFAVLLGGATALLPIFARDILHTGPWGLGLLRGAPAIGALAMSLLLTRHTLRRHVGAVMFGAVAVYGVATLVFALSTVFWLSLLALLVSGAADMVSVVIRQSLVQLETPDEMRGRVAAVNSVFIGASNQLGEFESGATAALLGPVGSVLLGAGGTLLVVALWIRLFPALARRQRLVEP
jgi:MFS family permease